MHDTQPNFKIWKKWITLIVLSSEECILLCNRTYKNTILKKAISELRYKYFHTCLSPAGTRLIKVGRFMINACLKWTNRQLASGECQHQTLLIWSLNENMNKWSYSTSPWKIWECLSRLKWMIYSITFVLEIFIQKIHLALGFLHYLWSKDYDEWKSYSALFNQEKRDSFNRLFRRLVFAPSDLSFPVSPSGMRFFLEKEKNPWRFDTCHFNFTKWLLVGNTVCFS